MYSAESKRIAVRLSELEAFEARYFQGVVALGEQITLYEMIPLSSFSKFVKAVLTEDEIQFFLPA